jgi:hypothetical protein
MVIPLKLTGAYAIGWRGRQKPTVSASPRFSGCRWTIAVRVRVPPTGGIPDERCYNFLRRVDFRPRWCHASGVRIALATEAL